MAHGVIYGQDGVVRVPLARTRLPINGIVAGSGVVAGATPNTFVVQELGYHQIDFDFNVNAPTNDTPFTLQLWNETTGLLIQSRNAVSPQQSFASDMYFGFEWNNASLTDEYAFYIVPNIGTAPNGFALLLQEINFRAVVQEFAGASGTVGPGTINRIAKFVGVNAVGDSIMAEAGTVISVAGSVNLAGVNTDTFLSFTDGQNVPVSAASTGRIRYNALTQTFQFSENGGAWADLSGVGPGTINRIAKFTAADAVGDSIMSEALTVVSVAGSVNLAGVNTDTFLSFTDGQNVPVSAASTGRIRYNALTQTFQFSENGGAWADLSGVGPGTINRIAKFTAADAVGDSIMSEALTVVSVAGSVNLAGVNTDTFLSFTDGQNVPVSAASTGRIRYNALTQTFQFSENGGAWADLSGVGPGTINRIAKFTAADAVGDSTITDDGTTVAINTSMSVTTTQTRLGVASSLTGSLVYANATNANTVTLQSGVTSASYTLTLPLAQSGAGQVLTNDGTGVLSWATPVLGSGSANTLAKFTAATTIGDSTITDDGTTVAINTSMSVTTTQTRLGVASSLTGALVYANATNANTVTIQSGVTSASYTLTLPLAQGGASQVLTNDGTGVLSWVTPAGTIGGSGSANTLAKFTAATTIGDSTITDNGTTVTINTSMAVTAAQTRLGVASTLTGALVYANATNANTVTIQSGVTSASYVLTLPTAQGGASQVLSNDGTGVLSWVTQAGTIGGSGSANALAKFTAATTIGDSTITDDGTTVTINTSMSVTATQTRLGVASSLAGSLVYANATNANTVTIQSGVTSASYTLTLPLAQGGASQVLSNDGTGVLSWSTPATGTVGGTGSANTLAKFTAASTIGDSTITDDGTTVTINTSMSVTATQTRLGVASSLTGSLVYANATNANTVTIQSGVTSASYVLTLPLAQSGAGQVLSNDGTGVLSWVTQAGTIGGSGSANALAKFTAATTIGDSTITDDGTTVTINTSMSVTATQTRLGVASSLAGSLVYANATNANTVTIQSGVTSASYVLTLPLAQSGAGQVLTNDGTGVLSWVTQAGTIGGSGSANTLAKFTAASTIGDSTITDDGTTVAINTSMSVTATQTRLGVASSLAGSLVYANATNANTVTIQSGVTSASYVLTLPLAQSGAGQVLTNDGTGVLSWSTPATGTVGGTGSANTLAKFTAASTIGDSTITDDGTTVAINTSMSVTATQTRLGVASSLTGSLVYANATNANTVTIQSGVTSASYTLTLPLAQSGAGQVLTNDGTGVLSWSTPATGTVGGTGSANTLAKFTAASTIGDSTITDDGTTVTINTSMSVTATQTRLGVASSLTGSLVYANATNANTVTIQSGVTSASYVLTLPLAQSGAGQVLTNDGTGVLSWSTPATGTVGGTGSANTLAKFTAASTIGDSTITDDGTTVAINTSMSVTATQTRLGVASSLTGSLVYANATNANTVTIQSGVTSASYTLTLPLAQSGAGQVLTNDGTGVLSWSTPATGTVGGTGSANTLAKFTAASTIGDSTITDDGTTVTINTSMSVTATQTRLGVASSLAGSLVYANATNANTVTIQSGVTSASYTLTLPLAQGGASQVLSNDGTGVLSWVTQAGTIGGSGSANALAKFTAATTIGDSTITDDGTTVTINTSMSVTATQTRLGVASSLAGSLVYANATNANTVTIQSGVTSASYVLTLPLAQSGAGQVLTNDGTGVLSWSTPATGTVGGTGSANTLAKFTAASTIGDSTITDDGTTVAINTSMSVTATQTRLGVASSLTGSLVYANATNANTVTIQSGVTSASYTLTLPLAQSGAGQVLTNDGTGVLSWSTPATGTVGGTGSANTLAKFTAASTIGDSTITDDGTTVTINTSMSVTATQTRLGVASSLAGSLVYANATNANTVTIQSGVTSASYTLTLPLAQSGAGQVLTNDGTGVLSWSTPGTGTIGGTGSANTLAKFTAASTIGDSTITDNGTTVTINTSMSVTTTQTRLGVASSLTGSLVYANATNANIVTIQSGVTSTSYTLTLPLAQGGASQVLTNDGTGVLSWSTASGGGAVTFNEPAGDNSAGTQGIFDSATVGETVAFPNLLYQKSDGKWWKADANADTTMPGLRMALESKNADETCSMLVAGRVRDDDWNWTVGGLIYASAAAVGGLTQTQPGGSGDQVQVVGVAYHADKMIFGPSPVLAEVV